MQCGAVSGGCFCWSPLAELEVFISILLSATTTSVTFYARHRRDQLNGNSNNIGLNVFWKSKHCWSLIFWCTKNRFSSELGNETAQLTIQLYFKQQKFKTLNRHSFFSRYFLDFLFYHTFAQQWRLTVAIAVIRPTVPHVQWAALTYIPVYVGHVLKSKSEIMTPPLHLHSSVSDRNLIPTSTTKALACRFVVMTYASLPIGERFFQLKLPQRSHSSLAEASLLTGNCQSIQSIIAKNIFMATTQKHQW